MGHAIDLLPEALKQPQLGGFFFFFFFEAFFSSEFSGEVCARVKKNIFEKHPSSNIDHSMLSLQKLTYVFLSTFYKLSLFLNLLK